MKTTSRNKRATRPTLRREPAPSRKTGKPSKHQVLASRIQGVQLFDKLPDSARVDFRTLCGVEGCALSTGWRRVMAGLWGEPIRESQHRTEFEVGRYRELRRQRDEAARTRPAQLPPGMTRHA